MPQVGPDVVVFRVTSSSATAAFVDISQQIQEFSGVNFEAVLQEGHSFGDAWAENLYTNFRQINEVILGGIWDDNTATGVRGLFGNATDVGAERVAKINLGTTNAYPKFDFLVRRVEILPRRGELTRFQLTLQPTGALTIVTT